MLWVSSYKTISNGIATFLSEVIKIIVNFLNWFFIKIIKQRELLSNKAVHLFLQSTLSVSSIRDNVEGRRDDEVAVDPREVIKDDRMISREGFGSLFGGAEDIARN